ncbi:5-(carboxyamino)imidazole ribonucleotide mutase [Candidatus Roizmanbacteria bacterium CG06_land_8_20_14_3_00_34_14]|uniref:N5-carboxyaminoimidazole ribonucleotide mutase n=2 Tax=Candidatus Roizmaniibacteriota TaxID=1752723 RepID=A0A2M7AVI8_9BACT|nr:MAG: 5-(carboxyamino)imidazole ribonucleotide mutase [Candidatus Roizmanbacteria bacterium CG07_land_8_20_14_0_80_34_15]PIU74632.1 MAG: 5-(carboxyamino)imidazole ribonucleotide mutase [Candidatus Roizmanbacteria bacterium CG06_land_8_20_14_3_00_34_14]
MSNITVSVLMGSDSDLPVMKDALDILNKFGVVNEVMVLSAHRTFEETREYTTSAIERGTKVIIAGAGGSAHLPGVIAAMFPLPVIGVPIKSKSLEGLDSLLSIVQMPPGIPVATVGINSAKNAGLLAVQILATSDKELSEKLNVFRLKQKETVLEKTEKLKTMGMEKYLKILKK